MKKISEHTVLLSAPTLQAAHDQVSTFFEKSNLVRYDSVKIRENLSLPATAVEFPKTLATAIKTNNKVITDLITELESTGIDKISQLQQLEQGYPSKTLHLLSHFIDGFISIDSAFYNFIDDSHHLPKKTQAAIAAHPEMYWIVFLEGYSSSPESADIALMHI